LNVIRRAAPDNDDTKE
jgi:phage I-like protein